MRKLLFIAVLSITIYSCEKDEDTNPKFRPISCEDSTDDGKFEIYTQPEASEFLRFYKNVPNAADANTLDYVSMSSRILYNNSIVFDPVFIYQQNRPTNLIIYLPTGGPEKYYSWVQNSDLLDTPLTIAIYNARKLLLPEGCHRLYYVFADVEFGTVLNKGHFDFEVRK